MLMRSVAPLRSPTLIARAVPFRLPMTVTVWARMKFCRVGWSWESQPNPQNKRPGWDARLLAVRDSVDWLRFDLEREPSSLHVPGRPARSNTVYYSTGMTL